MTALETDLYQLTMAAAYIETGRNDESVFELFVRSLPPDRGYLIAAGLEQAVEYLETVRFTDDDIAHLRTLTVAAKWSARVFDALRDLRFDGDLWAMPEGTPFFPDEPVLAVRASAATAQIVETYLLATINFQSMVATKAARVVDAAQGRAVFDFGTRRAHGPQAGLLAARAAYLAGCAGTSNVEAGRRFGIPAVGTMAHAWVMAHENESEAFEKFVDIHPDATLLIDTYDTIEGARRAARLGSRLKAVRLDSGDLAELSHQVRGILDASGCRAAQIVASGDLNEYKIASLLASGAPIDAFGVGTEMVTSRDAPALGGVYKLVERVREGRTVRVRKTSTGKATLPGRKQVWRDQAGDDLGLAGESLPGRPLLVPVLRAGRRVGPPPRLEEARAIALSARPALPAGVRRLKDPAPYPVRVSDALMKEVRG